MKFIPKGGGGGGIELSVRNNPTTLIIIIRFSNLNIMTSEQKRMEKYT